jgi:hypothetical protein
VTPPAALARPPAGLLAALGLTMVASAVFYYRQNWAGQVGGPMSIEKSLWLHYAITTWFVIPAFLVRHPAVTRPLRVILGSFLASMLGRGVIELWLIYVAFGWSPLYGIAHNMSNAVLFLVLVRRFRPGLADLDPFNAGVRHFVGSIRLSLLAESVFAFLFYRMQVHQEAVYFAPPTEAFAHITLLTRWVDVVVYADLGLFLWRHRHALFRRTPALARVPAA